MNVNDKVGTGRRHELPDGYVSASRLYDQRWRHEMAADYHDRAAEYHKEEGSHVASHFHKRAAAKHRQALAAYAELRPQLGLPPEDDRSAKSELEYNLPPVPEGHNRHTHFTNEGSVPNILKHGLRYGLHLGETTDAHGEDAASAINPLDLINDCIPIIGYLDDFAILTLALNSFKKSENHD
jgi:hypothetical protein